MEGRMDLTPVERHILVHLLLEGDDVPGNIGDDDPDSDRPHTASVSRSMKNLEKKGLVRHKGSAVYRLTNQGLTAARNVRNSTGSGS